MLTVTTLFEEEESKWKKYALPAALLGTSGLLYLTYLNGVNNPDPAYHAAGSSSSSENAYDTFKRGARNLYSRGIEKAEHLKNAAVQAWEDSEDDRQNLADSAARGAEKASAWGHATADAAARKWHETAPARQGILDRIQNGWNAHVQPQIDKAFPPSSK